jgi:hypothetical protein
VPVWNKEVGNWAAFVLLYGFLGIGKGGDSKGGVIVHAPILNAQICEFLWSAVGCHRAEFRPRMKTREVRYIYGVDWLFALPNIVYILYLSKVD